MSRSAIVVLIALTAGNADAQRTLLELRPRAGDTVRMRLDQVTEMSGTRKGAVPAAGKQMVTTLRMFSHAIVESTTAASATILAVTDSLDVYTSDERARPQSEQAKRDLQGRQMRLRLSPDGSVGLAEDVAGSHSVNDLVSVMPASFPHTALQIGDTWLREMPIPRNTGLGVPLVGVVRATFRLDSVTKDGDAAFVSMRGTLEQLEAKAAQGAGMSGTVYGNLVVNRRRGWLSESRFLVQMKATVPSPSDLGGAPLQFQMKITQHMKVYDKR